MEPAKLVELFPATGKASGDTEKRLYPDLSITFARISLQRSLRTGKCEEARPEDAHEG